MVRVGCQVDGPKSVSQHFSSLVKDGVGGHGGLMSTTVALIFSA